MRCRAGRGGTGAAERALGVDREGGPVEGPAGVLLHGQDLLRGGPALGRTGRDGEAVLETAWVPRGIARMGVGVHGGLVDQRVEPGDQAFAEPHQLVAVQPEQAADSVVGRPAALEEQIELVPVHPPPRQRLHRRPDLGVRHPRGVGVGGRVGQRDGVARDVLAAHVQADDVEEEVLGQQLHPAAADGQAQVEGDPVGAERERQGPPLGDRLQRPVGRQGFDGAAGGPEPARRRGVHRVRRGDRRPGVRATELAELPLPREHPQRVADLRAQRPVEVGGAGPALEPVPQADGRRCAAVECRPEVVDTGLSHGPGPSTGGWRRRDQC